MWNAIVFLTDGSIYNGFTHHVPVSEVFKLVADDPDRNLKTYTKNPAKNHIKSSLWV